MQASIDSRLICNPRSNTLAVTIHNTLMKCGSHLLLYEQSKMIQPPPSSTQISKLYNYIIHCNKRLKLITISYSDYCAHKNLPLDHEPDESSSHSYMFFFFKIHLNMIPPPSMATFHLQVIPNNVSKSKGLCNI